MTQRPSPFDPAVTAKAIHATLADALAALPPDRSGGIFIDATLPGTVTVTAAIRKGDGFELAAVAGYDIATHVVEGRVVGALTWGDGQ